MTALVWARRRGRYDGLIIRLDQSARGRASPILATGGARHDRHELDNNARARDHYDAQLGNSRVCHYVVCFNAAAAYHYVT